MGTARRAPTSYPLILSNVYGHFATNGHGTPCPYGNNLLSVIMNQCRLIGKNIIDALSA